MTLTVRNAVLAAGLCFAFILMVSFWVGVSYLELSRDFSFASEAVGPRLRWTIIAAASQGILAFVAGAFLHRFFRRIAAPSVFFFVIFVLCISLEQLRLASLLIESTVLPRFLTLLVTRTVYFGHFLSLFAIVAAGILSSNIGYQKVGSIMLALLAVSFAVAYTMGLDSTELAPNLLHRVGEGGTIAVVTMGFAVLGVLAFVLSQSQSELLDRIIIPLGVLLAVAGRELLFYLGSSWATIVGLGALVTGCALFGTRNYSRYLWFTA